MSTKRKLARDIIEEEAAKADVQNAALKAAALQGDKLFEALGGAESVDTINFQHFKSSMLALGRLAEGELGERDMKQLFAIIDCDGSGDISKDELKEFVWEAKASSEGEDAAVMSLAAMETDRRANALQQSPLLASISPVVLRQLADRMHAVSYSAGACLFRQGDPGDAMYMVESGSLSVTIDGVTRKRMKAGEVFGEIALMRPEEGRTATVEAVETTVCLRMETVVLAKVLSLLAVHDGQQDVAESNKTPAGVATKTNLSHGVKVERIERFNPQCRAAALVAALFAYIEEAQDIRALEMFFQVDAEGNGNLDVWEFEDALALMGVEMTPADMRLAFEELDEDAGGTVDIGEFMAQYRRYLRVTREARSGTPDSDEGGGGGGGGLKRTESAVPAWKMVGSTSNRVRHYPPKSDLRFCACRGPTLGTSSGRGWGARGG